MVRIFTWVSSLSLLVSLAHCTEVGSSYKHSLRAWHRHAEVFDVNSLRAELLWDAVHVTPTLRDIRMDREAQLRHTSVNDVRRHIDAAWWWEGTLFYINFFAPRDAKDLLAPDGYWRLELTDGHGTPYAQGRIVEVPVTPIARKLFPFLTHWSKTYLVVFPRVGPGPLALTLYGLNATSTLRWE
ncbi:MAG: hypothetical protein HYV02_04810 [Deltaproteobacteria bacterium]|nr:hypothetical protein [Deltaproteobacteria bacterium]